METVLEYPQAPGAKISGTSVAASKAVTSHAAVIREKVLAELSTQDLTPDECAEIIGFEKHSVRSRFSELVADKKIFKLRVLRKNASGCLAHVHTISLQHALFGSGLL